jgi:hypothetical protein
VLGAQAAREGQRTEAHKAIEQLERLRETQYVEPFPVLDLCSELKDEKQFVLWFKRADEERSTLFVYWPLMKDFYRFDPAVLPKLAKSR